MPGNWCPCVSRIHCSHCSTGNQRNKPEGSVHPATVPQNWALWSLCGRSSQKTPPAHKLCSPKPRPMPQDCASWSPFRKSGPKSPATCRFGSPKWAAMPQNCSPWSPCRKSGPQTPAALRLCSPRLQQLPWLLEVCSPMQVDPRASAAWWALYESSLLALLSHGYTQLAMQCWEPATIHPSEPQALDLANMLVPGGFPPHIAEAQHSSLSLTARESLFPHERARMPDSPLKRGKL
jgi:hypothetical protein